MSATPATNEATGLAPASRSLLGEKRKQDIKGAIKAGVEIVSFVATVTQNVPYLSIVSGSLTEIMKICDEMEALEGEWKAVKGIACEIREIVDATQEQCDELGKGLNTVPKILVDPLEKLQECIDRTLKILDECRPTTSETRRDGRLRAAMARGQRIVRKVVNRKALLDAVKGCRNDMDSTLTLFNTRLNVQHAVSHSQHAQKLDNMLDIVSKLIPLDVREESNVSSDVPRAASTSASPAGHKAVLLGRTSHALQSRDNAWRDLSGRHDEASDQDADWRAIGYQMRSVVSTFSREDQAIIRRAISRLASWAVESERDSSGAELTTQTSSLAAATAISMVATFLLLFMMSKFLSSVPRVFGWKPADIIIVDILDKEWVLQYDTFSSWEKTNRFLITQFANRPGASFVANGDYALGDTDHVRIAPEDWAQVVRPKARLKMAIVIHEYVPRCPFCRMLATGQEELTEDRLVICSDCGHTYGSYEGDGSGKIVELKDDVNISRERETVASSSVDALSSLPEVVEQRAATKTPAAKTGRTLGKALGQFKRVVVELARSVVELPAATEAPVSPSANATYHEPVYRRPSYADDTDSDSESSLTSLPEDLRRIMQSASSVPDLNIEPPSRPSSTTPEGTPSPTFDFLSADDAPRIQTSKVPGQSVQTIVLPDGVLPPGFIPSDSTYASHVAGAGLFDASDSTSASSESDTDDSSIEMSDFELLRDPATLGDMGTKKR